MTELHEFIGSLFEKSKILNNLNTQFLEDLQVGELTTAQKLSLLEKSTSYHQNILSTIQQIVRELDKTSVLISPDQAKLLNFFINMQDLNQVKALQVMESLQEAIFIPQNLMICPVCGNSLLSYTDNNAGCKKVPLWINGDIIGYTVNCYNKKRRDNESK